VFLRPPAGVVNPAALRRLWASNTTEGQALREAMASVSSNAALAMRSGAMQRTTLAVISVGKGGDAPTRNRARRGFFAAGARRMDMFTNEEAASARPRVSPSSLTRCGGAASAVTCRSSASASH
jgi:hypothetical protein